MSTVDIRERALSAHAWEIQALLSGRKTTTRRLFFGIAHENPKYGPGYSRAFWSFEGDFDSDGWPLAPFRKTGCLARLPCPYGEVGERLWVREAYKTSDYACSDEPQEDDHTCSSHCKQRYVYYAATPRVGLRPEPDGAKITYLDESSPLTEWYTSDWLTGARMPRWASRLLLEVTHVRVERLHDVTEEGARAEGLEPDRSCISDEQPIINGDGRSKGSDPYTFSLACRWDEANGDRALWSVNPFVWVVSHKRIALARPKGSS